MNSNLRRTCSVIVVLLLVGVLVQPFGRDAAAQSNPEDRLQGTWRGGTNPQKYPNAPPPPSPSPRRSVPPRRRPPRGSYRPRLPPRPRHTPPRRLRPPPRP